MPIPSGELAGGTIPRRRRSSGWTAALRVTGWNRPGSARGWGRTAASGSLGRGEPRAGGSGRSAFSRTSAASGGFWGLRGSSLGLRALLGLAELAGLVRLAGMLQKGPTWRCDHQGPRRLRSGAGRSTPCPEIAAKMVQNRLPRLANRHDGLAAAAADSLPARNDRLRVAPCGEVRRPADQLPVQLVRSRARSLPSTPPFPSMSAEPPAEPH